MKTIPYETSVPPTAAIGPVALLVATRKGAFILKTVWVFPMDGTSVWPRTSPGGKPAAYVTRNAGKSWQRLDAGLPASQGWFTVKRQAMSSDTHDPVGVYFGTTGGEVWASRNEGAKWSCIARHLPEIYAVETAGLGR